MEVLGYEREEVLVIRRWSSGGEVAAVFHFGKWSVTRRIPLPEGRWTKRLDSADERWGGPGSLVPDEIISDGEAALGLSPYAFVLFVKE
jgi:maltooligosyltrehalose trehalohydrolase